jgi:hypothetical protein
MVSQHRHEMFLTVAKPDREYINYLFDQKMAINSKSPSFLTLHCFGPLDTMNRKHVGIIGRLIIALTIQLSKDEQL